MAAFGLSQALGLIAGSPLSKAGTVIAEKLPVTKSMGLSGIGGMLSQVMSDGNLSSIMKNPVAALAGQVQAQAAAAGTQVQSALGDSGAGIVNALSGAGGLSEAVSGLKAAGDRLSGLGADPQGFFDLLGHGNTVGMLGAATPPAMSFDRAAGPVTSAPALLMTQAAVDDAVQAAVAGTLPPDQAAAHIQQQAAILRAITDGSASAIAMGQGAAPMLAIAAAVGGALAVPSWASPTPIQAVLGTLVQPEARRTMDAAVAASLGAGAKAHEGIREPLSMLGRLLKKIRGEA